MALTQPHQSEAMRVGRLGGLAVERLSLAQGMIPGLGIESRFALPVSNLLLLLSMSLPLCVCLS